MTKNRFYRAIFYNHEKLVNTGIVTCDSNFSAMYWYYSLEELVEKKRQEP